MNSSGQPNSKIRRKITTTKVAQIFLLNYFIPETMCHLLILKDIKMSLDFFSFVCIVLFGTVLPCLICKSVKNILMNHNGPNCNRIVLQNDASSIREVVLSGFTEREIVNNNNNKNSVKVESLQIS